MARGIFVLAVLSVAGTAALAQEAPQQEAATPTEEVATKEATATFSSKVNLVMVPVVVRDSSGHAVGTLRKEDFQLFDKGKLQFISKFSIDRPSAPLIVPNAGVETDSEGNTKNDKPSGSPGTGPVATRFVAWIFDD